MSEYRRAALAPPASAYRCAPAPPPATDSTARSSTNEFHAPQSEHLPSHFGDCAPHSWQTKTVEGRLANYPYTLSILVPTRQTTSQGIVPITEATSRTSIRSVPCDPMMTTS